MGAAPEDDQEPEDEWAHVAEVLALPRGVLTSRTQLSRVLRRAVIRLADPEITEAELNAIRELTKAIEDLAGD